MNLNILLLSAFIFASSNAIEREFYNLTRAREYFEDYIVTYHKSYSAEEKENRFTIFKESLRHYNEQNALNGAVYGITEFADMTPDEDSEDCMGDEDEDGISPCDVVVDSQLYGPAPPTLDYRQRKFVTPVKDQGRCKSCWAFASVGCLEGAYAKKHEKLLELSPKQLMDCLKCSGHCKERGSTMRRVFKELIGEPGVELEADYPYEPRDGSCLFDAAKAKVKVTSCINFKLQREGKLKEALSQYGPVGLAVYVRRLRGYRGGIVTVQECPPPVPPLKTNHAVLLVGYGKAGGKEYWLIKNSYGERFGESGYLRLEIGKNVCGLLNNLAVAAVVA